MVATLEAAGIAAVCLALVAGGCGSGGGRNTPTPPDADLEVEANPVDVGQRVVLDGGDSTDPEGDDSAILYLWTMLPPFNSDTEFESHCSGDSVEDGASEVCTTGVCDADGTTECTNDLDCAELDPSTCDTGCPDGETCLVEFARTMDYATFVPDVGGSYEVRMLIDGDEASDIALTRIVTNSTLYVVGSLLGFGGTQGGFIGASQDAADFAAGATTGVSSPVDGNIMLAVPAPARVREFDGSDATIVGTFGETDDFSDIPVALAYDPSRNLNVAYTDGVVRVFDGTLGLFLRVFGDVTAGAEELAAMNFSQDSGELFVVDGRAGQPLRVYDSSGGFLRTADTGAARATDLVFRGDPAIDLLVSDFTGDVIRCDTDGANCAVLGDTAALVGSAVQLLAIEVNPAQSPPEEAALLVADFNTRVVGCNADVTACSDFGETTGQSSTYADLLFAPPVSPTTTMDPDVITTTTVTTMTTTTFGSTTTTVPGATTTTITSATTTLP